MTTKYKWSEMSVRERDRLVGEKVMGWKVLSHWDSEGTIKHMIDDNQNCFDANGNRLSEFKPYSTDIAAAWEVVEKLSITVAIPGSPDPEGCTFPEYTALCFYQNNDNYGTVYERADTAPEAICKAALKAVGVEIED